MKNEAFGMDDDAQDNLQAEEAVKEKKVKKAFAYWQVREKEYKLKLVTEQTCKLEEKYRRNLIDLLLQSGGTLPPLGIMLTVIQAAMSPWEHGVKYKDIQKLFDNYVEEGGTQMALFSDIIMQLLMVSGFFTERQQTEMEEKLEEVKEEI